MYRYICIYIYVYVIYIHTHIYTYIYICIGAVSIIRGLGLFRFFRPWGEVQSQPPGPGPGPTHLRPSLGDDVGITGLFFGNLEVSI